VSRENVEIVRAILDSWGEGDFRAGADDLDPHVMFIVRPPLAEPGERVGPEGISAYMRDFLRQWTDYVIEGKDLKASGDTVLASTTWRATGRGSGVPMEQAFFMLFTFRGRKIVRLESIVDAEDALEAAGLEE
jgi:ketosteroid isomerase-like protein